MTPNSSAELLNDALESPAARSPFVEGIKEVGPKIILELVIWMGALTLFLKTFA